jgi:hypothetical protein
MFLSHVKVEIAHFLNFSIHFPRSFGQKSVLTKQGDSFLCSGPCDISFSIKGLLNEKRSIEGYQTGLVLNQSPVEQLLC